jgi:hypothetical protein
MVGIWGIAVTEGWRIKERKLSVQFGTFRVTKVDRLRAQYLRSLPGTYGGAAPSITAIDALNASHSVSGDPTFIAREAKILASVPVIVGLGLILGALLTAIFIFEAFLSKLYDGPGKSVLVSMDNVCDVLSFTIELNHHRCACRASSLRSCSSVSCQTFWHCITRSRPG